MLIWLDSSEEAAGTSAGLESRVREAVLSPTEVSRFGGLSLGESTHLIDEVCSLDERTAVRLQRRSPKGFLLNERGRLTLPAWVDQVGSARTRWVTGDLELVGMAEPDLIRMPRITP